MTKPGGSIVIFAPNRLYPFETHGAYIGGRYVFGNIPLVNWLPDPLRDRFAPHVRAYTEQGIRCLFRGQPVRLVHHRASIPGFDNMAARHPALGGTLRSGLYRAERTPLQALRPVPLPGGAQAPGLSARGCGGAPRRSAVARPRLVATTSSSEPATTR